MKASAYSPWQKNVPKTIAFLQHLRPQSLNELRKQFRAYAPHISAAESVDDASTELSFFLGQFRDIYHLPSVRLSFADLMSLRSIVVSKTESAVNQRVGERFSFFSPVIYSILYR